MYTPKAELGRWSAPVMMQVIGEVSTWLSTRCKGKDLPSVKKLAAVMAARSRPRSGLTKEDPPDAHEERNLWNQIVQDIKRLHTISTRAAEVSSSIKEMETSMAEGMWLTLVQESLLQVYDAFLDLVLRCSLATHSLLVYEAMFTGSHAFQQQLQTSSPKHVKSDDGHAISWTHSYSFSLPIAIRRLHLGRLPLLVKATRLLLASRASHPKHPVPRSVIHLPRYCHTPD